MIEEDVVRKKVRTWRLVAMVAAVVFFIVVVLNPPEYKKCEIPISELVGGEGFRIEGDIVYVEVLGTDRVQNTFGVLLQLSLATALLSWLRSSEIRHKYSQRQFEELKRHLRFGE